VISNVVPGTPAFDAGIRRGDLITAVDGRLIHDVDELMLFVGRLPAATEVKLHVQRPRDGNAIALEPRVELAKFPRPEGQIVTVRDPAWRGMRVDYATAMRSVLQDRLALEASQGGVVITEVESGSIASEAGLSDRMLVTHVDGRPVRTPRQFQEIVSALEGRAVELRMASGGDLGAARSVTLPDS
jgi:serine protease Do